MKKSSVNTFTKGLVCDLDPINVPNNVLTDCLNGTIITYDGNEYSLQNDKGNYPLQGCKLKPNFIPIGIKEYNGILYIVSLNPITGEEEVGSYPSMRSYSDNIISDDTNIELIIDNAFQELNSSEIDYSTLESKLNIKYFPKDESLLNVNDKFVLSDTTANKFEKIEAYVVGTTSHLVNDDWKYKDKDKEYYVSPVEGRIMLKNKTISFSDSDADITTFVCWNSVNPQPQETKNLVADFDLTSLSEWPTSKNSPWYNFLNCDSGLSLDIKSASTDNPNRYVEVMYNTEYTFALSAALESKDHDIYFNESANGVYCGKNTYLGLPIIDGKRLVKIELTQKGAQNSNRKVGIVSSIYRASDKPIPVTGGEFLSQNSNGVYTYDLSNTDPNLRYWIMTTGHTGIISHLKLTYEDVCQETYDCLFSFTNKLYINDLYSVNCLNDNQDSIVYELFVDVNGEPRIHELFTHSEINHYSDPNKVKYTIQSKPGKFLEWYGDAKIITKHFVSIIKDVTVNDLISVKIIPKLKYEESKYIVYSDYKTTLFDTISNYVDASWNVAKDWYRYYTYPINDQYLKQYIELDVSGPIEASNDIELHYNISNSSNTVIKSAESNILGIGQNLISIDYDHDLTTPVLNTEFVKENIYSIEFIIKIAGEEVYCSPKKELVTSQIFNDDMFSEIENFELIDRDDWITCYKKTINWGSIDLVEKSRSELTKSLWTYLTGNTDYFNRDIQFPTFITDSNYINYGESRLNGYLYNCDVNVTKSEYLTGPMWNITESLVLEDDLGKTEEFLDITESFVKENKTVPVGEKIRVKINPVTAVVGRYTNNTFPVVESTSATKNIRWLFYNSTVKVYDEGTPVYEYSYGMELRRQSAPDDSSNYQEYDNIVNQYFDNMPAPTVSDNKFTKLNVNITEELGENYGDYPDCNHSTDIKSQFYVCKGSNNHVLILPTLTAGHNFVKINADKSSKYENGYWCTLEANTSSDLISHLSGNFNINIRINNLGSWSESYNVVKNIDIPELPEFTEITDIKTQNTDDIAEFENLTNIVTPVAGKYVKGIARTDKKTYLSGISESYRTDNKLIAYASEKGYLHYDTINVQRTGRGYNGYGWELNGTVAISNGLNYYK